MQIEYKSKKLKKICTNFSYAEKYYSERMATIIHQRVNEIQSADSIEMMVKNKIGRCHSLKGKRKDQYAMDLVQPYRLVFNVLHDKVQFVKVIEIVDYHS